MYNVLQENFYCKNSVWFGAGDFFKELEKIEMVDIIFEIKNEIFRGEMNTKIFTIDIKPSTAKEIEKIDYLNSIKGTVFPLKTFFCVLNLLNNDKSRIKLSKRNEYKINANENYAEVLFANKTVGTLEPNIGRLFFLLKKHFNFNFKAKINSFIKTDVGEIAEIIVDKDYSFNSPKKGGELFKEIKEFLIGSENYSPFVKEKLSDFFRKKENIVIKKEECNPKDLTTLLLTIGIYYKTTAGKKSQIVVKNNEKKCTNKFLNEYFDINYSKGKEYPFTVFYDTKTVEGDSFINILL